MGSGDYNSAMQSFERARAKTRHRTVTGEALSVVSLVSFLVAIYILQRIKTARNLWKISGWRFDDLEITVQRHRCEALYAAGRIKEAGDSLLDIVKTVDKDVYMTEPIITWASGELCFPVSRCIRHPATDFLRRCLSTPEKSGDATLHSSSSTPCLREWAKLKLMTGSWRDALADGLNVSVSFYSATPRELHTMVRSLWPRNSRFIGLSVNISKPSTKSQSRRIVFSI